MLDYECLRLDVDVYCVPREEEMFSPAQHVEDEKKWRANADAGRGVLCCTATTSSHPSVSLATKPWIRSCPIFLLIHLHPVDFVCSLISEAGIGNADAFSVSTSNRARLQASMASNSGPGNSVIMSNLECKCKCTCKCEMP